MRRALQFIIIVVIGSALPAHTAIVVGGESVRFDTEHVAHFSATQQRKAAPATLTGLARVAATPHGRNSERK